MAKKADKAATPTQEPVRQIKVRALAQGYIHERRWHVGDVFLVPSDRFSKSWMEQVDPDTPEIAITGSQELARQKREMFLASTGGLLSGPGLLSSDNPLGAD